jgi:hypothetical protein
MNAIRTVPRLSSSLRDSQTSLIRNESHMKCLLLTYSQGTHQLTNQRKNSIAPRKIARLESLNMTLIVESAAVISVPASPVDSQFSRRSTILAKHASIRHSKANLTISSSSIVHCAMERFPLENLLLETLKWRWDLLRASLESQDKSETICTI